MDDQSTISNFIPKKDDVTKAKKHINRIRLYLDWALYAAWGIFILAVVAAIMSFLFKDFANDQLMQRQTKLFEARNEYKPEQVVELNRFDTRLKVATKLLLDHRRFHRVFAEIENNVLSVIQLKDAEMEYDSNNNIKVTGSGEAANFESLALQSDRFSESEFISNPIFTSFEENEEGLVSFQYSFTVDARLTEPLNALDVATEPAVDESDNTIMP